MNANEILTLYRYNAWANARILNAASQVTDGQFLAPASFSYSSLRGTLVHTLSAEWIWRMRWEGHSPAKGLVPEDFPTVDSLCARWETEGTALLSFAENVTEEMLEKTVRYASTKGQPFENLLWHLMLHLVNHGTQHRSEAAAMLTDFGQSPGDIDMIVFFRES